GLPRAADMRPPTPTSTRRRHARRRRSVGFAARRGLAAALGAACMMHAAGAAADVSSWLSAGGGYGLKRNDSTGDYAGAGSASFALGVGSDPTRSFVVGGLLRSTTYFSLGTDVGLS